MAAPSTLAILQERLYALATEASELRAACVTPPEATAAQLRDLKQVAKVIDRFVRDFSYGDSGTSGVAGAQAVSADFAARSNAETDAHIGVTYYDGAATTGFEDRINAVIAAAGLDAEWECTAVA